MVYRYAYVLKNDKAHGLKNENVAVDFHSRESIGTLYRSSKNKHNGNDEAYVQEEQCNKEQKK